MLRRQWQCGGRWFFIAAAAAAGLALSSCGGGTKEDSGPEKTYLRVEATDPDGDTLQYQWRATAGTIENKNSRETVWTMPDGPGVHFAYVVVSDGKGGYVEQQYAVATDALETSSPTQPAREYVAAARAADPEGSTVRRRFAREAQRGRVLYLPDMLVQVKDGTTVVFSGVTDLSGEISIPFLPTGKNFTVECTTSSAATPVPCDTLTGGDSGTVASSLRTIDGRLSPARNLRLYGHIAFKDPDGSVCGHQNDFFGLQSAATVQLVQADGTPLTPALRVNRFGDYAFDAAVPVDADLKLQVQCEGYRPAPLSVERPSGGFLSDAQVVLDHTIDNQRPRIVKMVANGPDGNVRGRMVVAETGVQSNGLPGPDQFLAYKGKDTPFSACNYYRSLGAVEGCDAQGRMINPISFADWKRAHGFGNGADVTANYINQMDLNLVRRMVATKRSDDHIAFYVCNNPGPEGRSQQEVDELMSFALGGEREVACVAMEWTVSPGVNGNKPFTKFLTFAPDGSLIPSINLDGRGEKYMPGACVACHGGSKYNGRFPDAADASPNLGAGFLAFDLDNFLFGSSAALTRPAQEDALRKLNELVQATAPAGGATHALIAGWYRAGSTFDAAKDYVGAAWTTPDERSFYRALIGPACRTCHASLGANFDWDSKTLPANVKAHVCGGGTDIALNVSMPNALISRDRITQRAQTDSELARLMTAYLGCTVPLPDPLFPKR